MDNNPVLLCHGGFFAIDKQSWAKVCALGINPAVSYLVMARGTLRDQRTTSWSTHAIEERTNIARHRAKAAIQALIDASLVRQDKGGSKPRYFLTGDEDNPDWIWLPNSLIDGASGETPPIELVRQTQNPAAIRLFIELYHAQSLQLDCGIHWRKLRKEYTRTKVAEYGPLVIWGFKPGTLSVWPEPLAKPHLKGKVETVEVNGEKVNRDPGWQVFWDALKVLEQIGLVRFVGHLIDADTNEGEIIHPYAMQNGEPGENGITGAAHRAAYAMLAEWQQKQIDGSGTWLIPVQRHLANVQLVGLVRLTYRARTKATASWYDPAKWESWTKEYARLEADVQAGKSISAPSLKTGSYG
ncbi:hypothetical protein [Beijerinckia indica]|uniref:Uncharacterized protein n=1 Tax=Beijerinckia indica subsp. indica (strain ATCC 9039 / DSM 1715 / NCIMB 8712) TaxID=395963 RepID=B2ICE3_BEII9|nr:hypothetical protein [Beijerinckia indica]ACB96740.1 hypothetical protein Bind_3180 [Beijerinckia indica subsp. indica ATCC 9039]